MAKFEFKVGRLFLDGNDISNLVTDFSIRASAREFNGIANICEIELSIMSNVEIEAEAVIYFKTPDGKRYSLKE